MGKKFTIVKVKFFRVSEDYNCQLGH